MTSIVKIRNLASILDAKDKKVAFGLIDKRDFATLKELIDSIVIKEEIKLASAKPEELNALNDKLEQYVQLQYEVNVYAAQFDPEPEEDVNAFDLDYTEEDDRDYYDRMYYMRIAKQNE